MGENTMTAITTDSLLQIENIIKSAKLVEISELIIDKDLVRGINKSKTAFILSELKLPDEFITMAINRPDVYLSRFGLVKNIDDFKSSVKIKDNGDDSFVEQIDFKSKSIKVQYRCCSPSMIAAQPKSIKDKDTYYIKFSQADIDTLLKAGSATDTANIKVIGNEEELSYELTDLTGDTITIMSDTVATTDDLDKFKFSFNFAQKSFLQLLKNCSSFEFSLGARGVFKIKVNNVHMYLLPQV